MSSTLPTKGLIKRAPALAAKMAFLVLGPMVDLKLIAMYATVFRPKAIVAITGITTLLIFALCVTGYVWIPMISSLIGR